MKFSFLSFRCELLFLLLCLISFSVTGCVTVSVNTDGTTLPGVTTGCEFDPNTGQVFCADACEHTYEHTITVAKHQSLESLNLDIVNNILEESQLAAQEAEGFFPGDDNVECRVSFKLALDGINEITVQDQQGQGLDQDEDGIIDQGQDDTVDTEQEYISLMQRPEWVKAVRRLYMCGIPGRGIVRFMSHISGCATDYPYKLAIVEYDEQNPIRYHGPLWLHEMGHTRGNTHTSWEQGDSWVMYGAPTEDSRKLSCRECARYLLP